MIKNLNKVVKPEDQELTSTIVINPILASAKIESDKLDKRTQELNDKSRSPIERDEDGIAQPFLGAKEQPVPADPVWPKFKLDESLFEELNINAVNEDLKEENNLFTVHVISDKNDWNQNLLNDKAFCDSFTKNLKSDGFDIEVKNFKLNDDKVEYDLIAEEEVLNRYHNRYHKGNDIPFNKNEMKPLNTLNEEAFNLKPAKDHSIANQINKFIDQAEVVEESIDEKFNADKEDEMLDDLRHYVNLRMKHNKFDIDKYADEEELAAELCKDFFGCDYSNCDDGIITHACYDVACDLFDDFLDESLNEAKDEDICCICNEPIVGYGNNAEPVCSGRCCDKCNMEKVIPARLKAYFNNKIDESRVSNEEAGPQEYIIVSADLEDKNGKQIKKNVNILYNKDGEPYVFESAEKADEFAQTLPEYTQYDFVGGMSRPKLSLWEEVYIELSADDFNSNEANKHRRVDGKEFPLKKRFHPQDDGLITFDQEFGQDENGNIIKTNKHEDKRDMAISGNDIILEPKTADQEVFLQKVIKAYNIPSFRVKENVTKQGDKQVIIHFADGDMSI